MSELTEKRDAEYGYHVAGGKAMRLQQWRERKDQGAFLVIVNRLRALNWQRAVYRGGGERLVKLQARKAAWMRDAGIRRRQERRGVVVACPACKAEWCPLPWAKGRRLTFCSRKCQRVGEWSRLREGVLGASRKPCRCGQPKAPGQGERYCARCKETSAA